MRSFSLFALAAAAIAPFVAAAPAPAPVMDLAVRGAEQKGVPAILTDLKVKLDVDIGLLNGLTSVNATVEVITPILKDVVTIVGDVVVDLKALVGKDVSVILCAVDGTGVVAVSVVAQLLADILLALCGALGFVLTVVADVKILVDIIVQVALGDCLCSLISVLLQLVAGLLACLVPLVLSLVDVLLKLGLDVVGKLLTIC